MDEKQVKAYVEAELKKQKDELTAAFEAKQTDVTKAAADVTKAAEDKVTALESQVAELKTEIGVLKAVVTKSHGLNTGGKPADTSIGL